MGDLVSIVVLSYNYSGFIEKTIRSLAEQDYNNVEIIVIDDGSTDDSVEVLKSLQSFINFKLFSKENGGVVSAINLGIEKANGVYIILHACDDISLPRRVSNQVSTFIKYPDAVFVSSNVSLVNADGHYQKDLFKRECEKIINIDDALLGGGIASVGCIYKTEILKVNKLDEKYIAEDPQIHLLLLSDGGYAVIDHSEPVLNYYLRTGSQMGTRFEELTLQHMDLLGQYKDNKNFKIAFRRVQVVYISFLSEINKKKAILYVMNNPLLMISPGIKRVILKMILPKYFHHIFKNIRT